MSGKTIQSIEFLFSHNKSKIVDEMLGFDVWTVKAVRYFVGETMTSKTKGATGVRLKWWKNVSVLLLLCFHFQYLTVFLFKSTIIFCKQASKQAKQQKHKNQLVVSFDNDIYFPWRWMEKILLKILVVSFFLF